MEITASADDKHKSVMLIDEEESVNFNLWLIQINDYFEPTIIQMKLTELLKLYQDCNAGDHSDRTR